MDQGGEEVGGEGAGEEERSVGEGFVNSEVHYDACDDGEVEMGVGAPCWCGGTRRRRRCVRGGRSRHVGRTRGLGSEEEAWDLGRVEGARVSAVSRASATRTLA